MALCGVGSTREVGVSRCLGNWQGTSCLDNGNVVDLILFDFAKAFDVVSHPILLSKLRLLGVHVHLIRWIEDFLVGRTMSVSVVPGHFFVWQIFVYQFSDKTDELNITKPHLT